MGILDAMAKKIFGRRQEAQTPPIANGPLSPTTTRTPEPSGIVQPPVENLQGTASAPQPSGEMNPPAPQVEQPSATVTTNSEPPKPA